MPLENLPPGALVHVSGRYASSPSDGPGSHLESCHGCRRLVWIYLDTLAVLDRLPCLALVLCRACAAGYGVDGVKREAG